MRNIWRQRAQVYAAEPPADAAVFKLAGAWHDLNTERDGASGLLPMSEVRAWADFHDLDHDATMLLLDVIRYLEGDRVERSEAQRTLDAAVGKGKR